MAQVIHDDASALATAPWVPRDTFGARLAVLRQHLGGWNVKRAADACGLDDQKWRNWEAGRSKPRDLEAIARQIAESVGCDYVWLMAGGPLRSRCFSVVPDPANPLQTELWHDPDRGVWLPPSPRLAAVRSADEREPVMAGV